MARISRRQLKQDRFVEEVGHQVEYVSSHRKQIVIWAVVVIGLVVGGAAYVRHQRSQEDEARKALQEAVGKFHGRVDTEERVGFVTFPTNATKYRETTEALEKVRETFAGRPEAVTSEYYLALVDIEQGKSEEARTKLEAVVAKGGQEIASLARLALADLLGRQKQDEEARKHYQYLIDHPSSLVPRERAQLAWGRYLAEADPEQARQVLSEIMKQPGPAAVAAGTALRELEGS